MKKSVMAWRSPPKTERKQDRARDNYQRFIGIQVTTYECELAPAGPVPALRQGLYDLPPGRYYAVQVQALRNGAPWRCSGNELKFYPTAAARDAYIKDRMLSYRRRIAQCTSTNGQ
jgi:hypothetical protein